MSEYWITTHWPTPDVVPGQSRHVFLKDHNIALPAVGDFVFFRESAEVVLRNKKVRWAVRHHRGAKARFKIPTGSGGIIGTATVDGPLRDQVPADVVFDFGDLPEWKVIPCRDFQPCTLLLGDAGDKPSSESLRGILGVDGVRFLSLWKIPNPSLAGKLLKALKR